MLNATQRHSSPMLHNYFFLDVARLASQVQTVSGEVEVPETIDDTTETQSRRHRFVLVYELRFTFSFIINLNRPIDELAAKCSLPFPQGLGTTLIRHRESVIPLLYTRRPRSSQAQSEPSSVDAKAWDVRLKASPRTL